MFLGYEEGIVWVWGVYGWAMSSGSVWWVPKLCFVGLSGEECGTYEKFLLFLQLNWNLRLYDVEGYL